MSDKQCGSACEAVRRIPDGVRIAVGGPGSWGNPSTLVDALVDSPVDSPVDALVDSPVDSPVDGLYARTGAEVIAP